MTINIQLKSDEALILFELLASDSLRDSISKAEAAVFSSVLAGLERELVEPFSPNYKSLLAEAEKSVLSRYGE